MPTPPISAARLSERSSPRPVGFAGPLRQVSSSEYRAPSGTVTELSSRAAWCGSGSGGTSSESVRNVPR